mmetsp:Transcript_78/g.229  ORF Transcript_78/g.229 Transcript_78/m.229 type:complete len:166 (+) Transcript_78:328-825(+)
MRFLHEQLLAEMDRMLISERTNVEVRREQRSVDSSNVENRHDNNLCSANAGSQDADPKSYRLEGERINVDLVHLSPVEAMIFFRNEKSCKNLFENQSDRNTNDACYYGKHPSPRSLPQKQEYNKAKDRTNEEGTEYSAPKKSTEEQRLKVNSSTVCTESFVVIKE